MADSEFTYDAQFDAEANHDCKDYAIHGPLAEQYYKAPIEVCMKCTRWRSPRYSISDWQPWNTMNGWIYDYRKRTGK